MKEHQAAIQALRTALDDPTAPEHDIPNVLYVLGRCLESIGKVDHALEVYHRLHHSIPEFKDVANRVQELQQTVKQTSRTEKSATDKHSWFSGVMGSVQRLLIGNRK
jgi:hypothetical protein